MNKELLELYNKFTKIHNQFTAVKRSCKRIDEFDIYPGELQVLALINSNIDITVSDIATRLYMTKSAASQAIKKLNSKGLITKRRSVENERKVILEVTDRGVEVITSFFNDSNNPLYGFIEENNNLSPTELKTIRNFLNGLESMFDKKLE